MNDIPPYANLRDGGNLPPKPYRWIDWHTLGLIVSMLILAVMAVIFETYQP